MSCNHLANQKSPYLLQHVQNPVDWYPWGPEAFQKSKSEQKPILLSIGYSTCHWCHVMAHESFENEEIAKVINQSFVSIKVDREERPDIDQIYMAAASMMTGQGGWPLTVFLTPEGKPFYAGTYFPPYAKWGSPGFTDVLNSVSTAWQNQKQEILSSSQEITRVLSEQKNDEPSHVLPDSRILDRAFEQISYSFDSQNGGFSSSPKFPMGHQLSFLLRYYKRSQNLNALMMVESTLKGISEGGVYDQLAGGLHRYSTDAYWHVPHFEKMLYDQALLVKALLEAYQITGKKEYSVRVRTTLDYVLKDLQNSQGGFYTAEDADSLEIGSNHKAEGAFYVWSKAEITQALGTVNSDIFNYIYGVKPDGNASYDPHGEFTGKNILYQEHTIDQAAEFFKLSNTEVEQILKESEQVLLKIRESRPRPHLDDKILTDWNGLMIGAFAQAGAILNEPKYILAAQRAANFISEQLYKDQKLLHSWCKEPSTIPAMLNDYTFLINGLLDIYEANGGSQYFDQAKELADAMINSFEDAQKGGFYLTSKETTDLILRPKEYYDGAIPSGNSSAILSLIRLYHLTSQKKWMNHLEKALKNFLPLMEKMPSAYTFGLCALDFYCGPSISITLEGNEGDSKFEQMKKIVYKYFIPNKTISFKKEIVTQAYVCQGNTCQTPTNDVHQFEMSLLN